MAEDTDKANSGGGRERGGSKGFAGIGAPRAPTHAHAHATTPTPTPKHTQAGKDNIGGGRGVAAGLCDGGSHRFRQGG